MSNETDTNSVNSFKIMSWGDLITECKKHESKMNKIFRHDKRANCLVINVVYEYDIDLSDIKSKSDLMRWVYHLLEKNWINTDHLHEFIKRVCLIKGWDIFSDKLTKGV